MIDKCRVQCHKDVTRGKSREQRAEKRAESRGQRAEGRKCTTEEADGEQAHGAVLKVRNGRTQTLAMEGCDRDVPRVLRVHYRGLQVP
jgi:hypothetical protein